MAHGIQGLEGPCGVRSHSSPWVLRTPLGLQAGLGQADAMTLSPRHFGSHNLGRRDLFITTGEIMGLVLLPRHLRDEAGGRGTNSPPPYNSSSKGTLLSRKLRTTHSQEGASTEWGSPSAHRLLVSLSLPTAWADLRVSRNVPASPTLTGPRISQHTLPKDSYPTQLNYQKLGVGAHSF